MEMSSLGPTTTTTVINFCFSLFTVTAILQTSLGARSYGMKAKRRSKALVKHGRHLITDVPQLLSSPPQAVPAATTDLRAKSLSPEIQCMQENARKYYYAQLERRADHASLKVLEAEERSKVERLARNDRESLAILEKAAEELSNKMTHCTPSFQPTLWQRPSRQTASISPNGGSAPQNKLPEQTPPSDAATSSKHTLGPSYAVFSPKTDDKYPKSTQQGSPMVRLENLPELDPVGAAAQDSLEEKLAKAMSTSSSSKGKSTETRSMSSPSRSMRGSGKVNKWLKHVGGEGKDSNPAPLESSAVYSPPDSSPELYTESIPGESESVASGDTEGDTASFETLSLKADDAAEDDDEDVCKRLDFSTEALRRFNELQAEYEIVKDSLEALERQRAEMLGVELPEAHESEKIEPQAKNSGTEDKVDEDWIDIAADSH